MQDRQITLHFNLDDEQERRVYDAIVNLPAFYKDDDMSKSLIRFIDTLVSSIGECEERRSKCEAVLKALVGAVPKEKKVWN